MNDDGFSSLISGYAIMFVFFLFFVFRYAVIDALTQEIPKKTFDAAWIYLIDMLESDESIADAVWNEAIKDFWFGKDRDLIDDN